MKKIISLLLSGVLLILCCGNFTVLAIEYDTILESSREEEKITVKQEEKIYCDATLEDDFEDDSVIVVFKNAKSRNLDNYSTKSFADIPAKGVNDLTSKTKNKIEKQRKRETNAKATSTLGTVASADEMIVDENNYHQIVKIDLKTKSKENVLACIQKLEARDDVLMACPNYYFKPTSEKIPNDPYFSEDNDYDGQWGSRVIDLPQAWNITTGSSTVKVGVLDSGIDNTHPDLQANYNSTLSKEFSGGNSPNVDITGHGTQVAGIIGAKGNNSRGVAGICWNVSLVSLKVTYYNANGDYMANLGFVAKAIDYATDNNISILNFSYCGEDIYDDELEVVWKNYPGLFICSTTNERKDVTNGDYYYYDYNASKTIVVTATNSNDTLLEFRNSNNVLKGASYSATRVHLAAPGDDIWTTTTGGGYICTYGTSMATPYVTGVAALLKSKYPSMSATAMKYYILNGVDKINALADKVETGGRLNAYKALNGVKTFTVKYNSNGGTGTMSDTTVIYNNTTKLRANTFTNSGAEFKGWTAKRSSDNKWYYTNGTKTAWYLEGSQPGGYEKYVYKDKQSVARTSTVKGDVVTMYAQWKISYTLKFNSNNGSGTMSSLSKEYGALYQLPANSFTRSRCTFDHWYAKNQDGETYCVGASGAGWYDLDECPDGYVRKEFSNQSYIYDVTMQKVTNGDVITMYAYWEPTAAELGDVNMDGKITIADATLIQKYVGNQETLTADQLVIADVNYSGSVTVADATAIQKYVAGTKGYLMY